MWIIIFLVDVYFVGFVILKMDIGFWDNYMYIFIVFNYFCYKCILGIDLFVFFLSWFFIFCFYF